MSTDAGAEAMLGSGDMVNSGDELNDEIDPVESGEGEGDKPKKLKLDGRGNPFSKHPESWSVFTSITESRYRDNIMVMEQELLDYAESHQMMLRDRLTYEELRMDAVPGEMRSINRC